MKKPNIALHLLFSIYGWTITFVFLFFLSALSITLRIFFSYPSVYKIIRTFRWVLRFLFCSVQIQYHPNFDHTKPYVLAQNHVNLLDAFIAACVSLNPLCGLMHNWQFKIPFYGWMMHLSKSIRVFPKRKDNFQTMTKQARLRKKENISIVTFPEGGRTLDGKCKPFKKGVFKMAAQAGLEVVPVAVWGNYFINQKGSKKLWPHPIKVWVGAPVDFHKLDRQEFLQEIQKMRKEIDDFAQKPTF